MNGSDSSDAPLHGSLARNGNASQRNAAGTNAIAHEIRLQMRHRITTLITIASVGFGVACAGNSAYSADPPHPRNIVFILADDLGYGDLGCYNKDSKIPTPILDRLASEGMRFTDAHAPASVCSPTRYALLTGRYAWRTSLQRGVLGPWGTPLVAPDRLTVASLLKQHG